MLGLDLGSFSGLVSLALCVILAVWLVLSIIVQFVDAHLAIWRLMSPLRTVDRFALLPAWTFFAPQPGQTDIHLLFRDITDSSTVTAWREVLPDRSMRAFDAVWDPKKRAKKILVDFTQGLMEKAKEDANGRFRLTGEYICLLNYVVHLESTPYASHRQFAIVESRGYNFRDNVAVMFVSDVHPVERAPIHR